MLPLTKPTGKRQLKNYSGDEKMMVKEISIGISQKLNTGNYESKGISLGVTVELSESDDLLKAKQLYTDKLNQMLDFEIKKIKEAKK